MKKLSLARFAMLGFLSFGLPAHAMAESFTMPDGKPVVSITIPDDWETGEIDDGVEATSPDKNVYIAAELVKADNVEAAAKEALKYLVDNGVVIDEATKKEKTFKIGDLEAYELGWQGKDEDGPTEVSVAIVVVAPKKLMFLTYWATPEGGQANAAGLAAIAQSITPVK